VCADGRAIKEGHAERHAALLDEVEQALPNAPLRPADEQLRRQPPRAEFGRDPAPLGAVLVPPEDRRDGPPQVLGRCLPTRPHLVDQRLPLGPSGVRENLASIPISHAESMGTASKL
jgi:hypothetical protein